MGTERQQQYALGDAERLALAQQLKAKLGELQSKSLGFKRRGSDEYVEGAVMAKIPRSLEDAEKSVCGVKGFMIDQVREFTLSDGTKVIVDCAAVAKLDMTDSPVHFHGETLEVYIILKGKGKMVRGEEVIEIEEGDVILIPPGVEHGVASDDPDTPIEAILTFTPGLAPKEKPEFRDEEITHLSAKARIEELVGKTGEKVESATSE